MKRDIPAALIKKAAVACDKKLACLEKEDYELCPIEQCVMHRVHFVVPRTASPCRCKMNYGNGSVCTCPVRKHIYNTDGV